MSLGTELLAADELIASILSADSTLQGYLGAPGQIYMDTIPKGVTYPFVFAQMMDTRNAMTTDQTTVLVEADYQIKGVDRGKSYTTLTPIAQRIHTLLHGLTNQVLTNGLVLKCAWQRSVHYPEVTETVSYRHLGGLYRFWVEGA